MKLFFIVKLISLIIQVTTFINCWFLQTCLQFVIPFQPFFYDSLPNYLIKLLHLHESSYLFFLLNFLTTLILSPLVIILVFYFSFAIYVCFQLLFRFHLFFQPKYHLTNYFKLIILWAFICTFLSLFIYLLIINNFNFIALFFQEPTLILLLVKVFTTFQFHTIILLRNFLLPTFYFQLQTHFIISINFPFKIWDWSFTIFQSILSYSFLFIISQVIVIFLQILNLLINFNLNY